jgi:hypothetical protein
MQFFLLLSQEGRRFVRLLSGRLSVINVLSNTMNCDTCVCIMHCSCIKSLSLNLLRCTAYNTFCIDCSLHFSRSEVTSFLPLETSSVVKGACVSGSCSRPYFFQNIVRIFYNLAYGFSISSCKFSPM